MTPEQQTGTWDARPEDLRELFAGIEAKAWAALDVAGIAGADRRDATASMFDIAALWRKKGARADRRRNALWNYWMVAQLARRVLDALEKGDIEVAVESAFRTAYNALRPAARAGEANAAAGRKSKQHEDASRWRQMAQAMPRRLSERAKARRIADSEHASLDKVRSALRRSSRIGKSPPSIVNLLR